MEIKGMRTGIGYLMLTACLSGMASSAGAAPAQQHVMESVIILSYSERPAAGSGYVHFLRAVTVATSDGGVGTLFVTYYGEDQFFPAIGARCSIGYEERNVRGVIGGAVGRQVTVSPYVTRFDCPKGTAAEGVAIANPGS